MPGTLLQENDSFELVASGRGCRVTEFLGWGGEGEVYEAAVNGGHSLALKAYYGHTATQQKWDTLVRLLESGTPDERFLWPLDLVRLPSIRSFGYVMPKREPRFHGLVSLMRGEIDTTFRALVTAAYGLADGFLRLHALGLCYRDISFGNVFFDPVSGEVLICDNDNVGINRRGPSEILGTPRFMAPEVVRGEAMPSAQTDLFSLSVLLFYLLLRQNPLEGARELEHEAWDEAYFADVFGRRPTFIFDPDDDSNRPVPGLHDAAIVYWPLYPPFIQSLFVEAFTAGTRDPDHGRVRETTWKSALVRLRDSIAYCRCGAENFLDLVSDPDNVPPVTCWACQAIVPAPYRLRFKRNVVALNHDSKLFPHHVLGDPFNFETVVGAMEQHPTDPRIWGIRNQSGLAWTVRIADGSMREVEPGRAVRLQAGSRIYFPQAEAEVLL